MPENCYLRCRNCGSTSFSVVVQKDEPEDRPKWYECAECGGTSIEPGPDAKHSRY